MAEHIIRPAEPKDLEAVNTLLGQVLSLPRKYLSCARTHNVSISVFSGKTSCI